LPTIRHQPQTAVKVHSDNHAAPERRIAAWKYLPSPNRWRVAAGHCWLSNKMLTARSGPFGTVPDFHSSRVRDTKSEARGWRRRRRAAPGAGAARDGDVRSLARRPSHLTVVKCHWPRATPKPFNSERFIAGEAHEGSGRCVEATGPVVKRSELSAIGPARWGSSSQGGVAPLFERAATPKATSDCAPSRDHQPPDLSCCQ